MHTRVNEAFHSYAASGFGSGIVPPVNILIGPLFTLKFQGEVVFCFQTGYYQSKEE